MRYSLFYRLQWRPVGRNVVIGSPGAGNPFLVKSTRAFPAPLDAGGPARDRRQPVAVMPGVETGPLNPVATIAVHGDRAGLSLTPGLFEFLAQV
jgi:hypothetical protein